MDAFIHTLREGLRAAAIWELNGLLALLYTAWAHVAALIVAGAWAALLWWTPPGRRGHTVLHDQFSGQRPWLLAVAALVVLAAFVAKPPAPALLATMTVAGMLAVTLDRFNPDGLRWRVAGGLALYALAACAYLEYGAYLDGLDAMAWAEALGGQGEAAGSAGPRPGLHQHPGHLGPVADPAAGVLLALGPGPTGPPALGQHAGADDHRRADAGAE